jgi:NUMOD4 motif/HNH endonuclease
MKVWKAIAGFEGRYEVSSDGDVRSLNTLEKVKNRWGGETARRRIGRTLAPQRFPNGYLSVRLGRDNCHLVHRLVAAAFIPGDQTLQVNHKNGVRDDNSAANLEWLTASDNHRHSYRELNRKKHALTRAVTLTKAGQSTAFPSELAAAKHLGVVAGSVCSAVTHNHRCKGHEVAYV